MIEHTHGDHLTGCLICGGDVIYGQREQRECALCHRSFLSSSVCVNGHYVCDSCHGSGARQLLGFFCGSNAYDPLDLFYQACDMPGIRLHGPEHHVMVPCVLLTAYCNCANRPDLPELLAEAMLRAEKVPGGTCGSWGVCGAAAGAGIFASILLDSTPMNSTIWQFPQLLVAKCLERIGEPGGPRCCKRTGRMAIETAAAFSGEYLGVPLSCAPLRCPYASLNKECLHERCPYFA